MPDNFITFMNENNYKYSELTKVVIGLAMKVHRKLGLGFPEIVYKRALTIELKKAGLSFVEEKEQPIFYEEEWVGTGRVDILLEEKVLLELKAISEVDNASYNQIQNCLEAFKIEVGLLINFGSTSLQFKRFVNKSIES